MEEFELLSVGKESKLVKGKNEGVGLYLDGNLPIMILSFVNPTKEEVKAVERGELKFHLVQKENVLFLLGDFLNAGIMETPIIKLKDNCLEKIENNDLGYGVHIILGDPNTGIIHAMRIISLGNDFSKKLYNLFQTSDNNLKDHKEILAKIIMIQNNYTTKELLKYSISTYTVKGLEQ